MTNTPNWHRFETPDALAERFADDIAAALVDTISRRGCALLAVSGGKTPAKFFRALSSRKLPWADVTVVPVDERFVPTTSERSNEKLIRENLLINEAAQARFTPLFHQTPTPQEAADLAEQEVAQLSLPLDVVILGMGGDGHTASFFPDSPDLADVTDPQTEAKVRAVTAPSADEPRLTLTLSMLLEAPLIALHIEGEDKRALFEGVVDQPDPQQRPISAVLLHASRPLQIYWSPKQGEQS